MGNRPSKANKAAARSSPFRDSTAFCNNNGAPAIALCKCKLNGAIPCCCKENDNFCRVSTGRSKGKACSNTSFSIHCQNPECEKYNRLMSPNTIFPLIVPDNALHLKTNKRELTEKKSTGTNSNVSFIGPRAESATKNRSNRCCCQAEPCNPQTEGQLYRLSEGRKSARRKGRSKLAHHPEYRVQEPSSISQPIVEASCPRSSTVSLFAAVPSLKKLKEQLETFSALFSLLPDDLRNASEKLLDFQHIGSRDEGSIQAFSASVNSMLASMHHLLPSLERHIFVAQDLSYALHRLEERISTFHKLLAQVNVHQGAIKF